MHRCHQDGAALLPLRMQRPGRVMPAVIANSLNLALSAMVRRLVSRKKLRVMHRTLGSPRSRAYDVPALAGIVSPQSWREFAPRR